MSFHTLTQPDLTVTVDMHVYVNGAEEALPADWKLHVVTEGSRTRVTVERDGEFMTLGHALALRDALTTSSRPALRRQIV